MTGYHYTQCGLDNVVIHGTTFVEDDAGEQVVSIPNINGLHKAIALGIVSKQYGMSGKELRFLRTELGMTQAELANTIHREALTISRWERNESPLDENAETLIRIMVIETLGLESSADVRELSGWSTPSAADEGIQIDGTDPDNYRPIAA